MAEAVILPDDQGTFNPCIHLVALGGGDGEVLHDPVLGKDRSKEIPVPGEIVLPNHPVPRDGGGGLVLGKGGDDELHGLVPQPDVAGVHIPIPVEVVLPNRPSTV